MKVIDLLNKIANGEIEDKTKFRIYFANNMYRDIYYDDEEQNQLNCLKNVSDDYSIYDDICLLDEVEILEEEKKIPEKIPEEIIVGKKQPTHRIKKIEKKINEIISYLDYLKSKGE